MKCRASRGGPPLITDRTANSSPARPTGDSPAASRTAAATGGPRHATRPLCLSLLAPATAWRFKGGAT